jgi:hypothetical protein
MFVPEKAERYFNRIIALAVSVSGAILFVEIVKVTVFRADVSEYLAVGAYGFRYPGFTYNSDLSSFPSEYGAISGAITVTLCKMMPSYRPTLILLAFLLSGGQIITGVDFVSDILSGLAIEILSCLVVERLLNVNSRAE